MLRGKTKWLVIGLAALSLLLSNLSFSTVQAQTTGGPSQPIQVDFSGLVVDVYKSAQQQQLISSSNPAKIYDTNNPEGVASQFLVKFRGVKLKNISGNNLTCTPIITARIASSTSSTKIQVGSNLGTSITMANIPPGNSVEIPADNLSYIPYAGGIRDVSKSEVVMARTGGAGGKLEVTVGNITGCGGSIFTSAATSDNILWPAIRALVTHSVNGQQVPLANTGIKICRPNSANACGAGSPDGGLSYFTDTNGYFGLALTQKPDTGTSYIITTAAANGVPARTIGNLTIEDYRHHDITVSVDDDCRQALIPHSRKMGFVNKIKQTLKPPTVSAQGAPCLPDLKLDATGLKITVTDREGRSYTRPLQELPIGIGYDIKKIEISGVKIKNAGTGPATGKTCFTLWHLTLIKEKYKRNCTKTEITLNLQPGQSVAAPTISVPFGGPFEIQDSLSMLINGKTTGLLVLDVDSQDSIQESDEHNNSYTNDAATTWAAIKVVLSTPISRAVIRFTAGNGTWPLRASVTNPDGVAYLVPTESLHSGPKKYRVVASLGSQALSDETPVTVDKHGLTTVRVNAKGFFYIKLFPKIEFSHNSIGGDILPAGSGEATIQSKASGRTFTASAKNGLVTFSPTEVLPGKYKLLKASAQYKEHEIDIPLDFEWPEKTQNETGGQEFDYISGAGKIQFLLLGKQCGTLVAPTLTYCSYNDTDGRKHAVETLMPIARQVASRMLKWPSYAPSALKQYTFSPDPTFGGAYYRASGPIVPLVVMNSVDKLFQESTTYHELFHLIDDYATDSRPGGTELTENPDYRRSIDIQLASVTGKKLWNYYLRPLAYDDSAGGYSATALINKKDDKYGEAFAEEKSATCVYKQQVIGRLNDAANYWRNVFGTQPPSDLIAQRDNALNRLNGLLPTKTGKLVKNDAIATLHQHCLTK